ncbi:MAG: polysaccharide pyruvyl transferase family protein [bacterium]|nr:polysaccharide pyruvyl transferase family protein [bacterium]
MNVLLFGNIGTAENGFYHVGDEAMFLETYNWYQKNYPKSKLTSLCTLPNHQDLNIKEITNPIPFENFGLYKLICTTIQACFIKNPKNKLISLIKNQDRIHFFGGGNITSKYRTWLYYSLTIISVTKIFKKELILTSQTIGPFIFIDKIISRYLLNFAKIISIRGIDMLDAAYNLANVSSLHYPKNKNIFRIGLSLNQNILNNNIYNILIELLSNLSSQHKVEVMLLPHVIVNSIDKWDLGFMSKLTTKIQNKIKIILPNPIEILNSYPNPASTIKYLTSTSDMIITSRYHGLIFALSQNIPVIAITSEKYSRQKITNALKLIYKYKYSKYIISNHTNKEYLYKKLKHIINNQQYESKTIKQINNKLLAKYDLFYNNLNNKIL